jgi:tetratricopeptide (TPR) repeat protein
MRSIWKENSESEANITDGLASIYSEAGLLDIAEDYHRKALSLEPDNPYLLNNLAWFLIDKDRNIEEGLELIEKAREFDIDEYYYVDCMGYGLLKLGKYYEALKFLERSDSLKPIYNHDLFLNLEAAKKAVAEQKANKSL